MKKAYIGNCILPERILSRGIVVVESERILSVSDLGKASGDSGFEIVDLGENFIAPGFIDLHLHGALGKDILDADVKGLKVISSFQARHGVTGFVGATMSTSFDFLVRAVEAVKAAQALSLESEILGVYIEGPFINVNKKGAHNSQFVGNLDEEEIERILEVLNGLTAIVPFAPEIPQHMNLIQKFKKRGVIAAIGHSNATYSQANESFKAGVSHATHLFNAMRDFHHREPGVVGAVLDSKTVTSEIVADGVHVHPASIRIALAQMGVDRICLVTDSFKASGLGDGVYEFGNSQVFVEGEKAVLLESNTLAGSVLPLNRAMKNILDWCELSVPEVVKMVTVNPARILGLEDRIGCLKEGHQANLVMFDEEFNIKKTILKGREVYSQTEFE
ncbi:MAG: N-acetylglucosamine-6-phosphate deacetylase [Candidatus Aminicenantes bacterium]|nr:N-acetylglucosamine-6-phosphate deacetylase [Candidatus Aminicenantes bacterium]